MIMVVVRPESAAVDADVPLAEDETTGLCGAVSATGLVISPRLGACHIFSYWTWHWVLLKLRYVEGFHTHSIALLCLFC